MKIRNVIHKGLKRFIEDDDGSGLPPAVAPKVRKIHVFPSEHGTRRRAQGRSRVESTPEPLGACWSPKTGASPSGSTAVTPNLVMPAHAGIQNHEREKG
jgi:hypothetical protein